MTELEVIDLVRSKIKEAGSLRALAREWKISPAYLSRLMHYEVGIGYKILDRLDLRQIVRVEYQPASWRNGER